MNHQIDFIAIGDITIDAFITLLPDGARVLHGPRGKEELCVSFGDKIPYDSVEVLHAVGNSPNAAVSAARLGLATALVANLGDDENGARCIAALEHEGVRTEFVKKHPGIPTNYHFVLRYEEERTILIKHEIYPYALPDLPPTRWAYVSSLGAHSLPYHAAIAQWLADHPAVKLAFQPGTFQIKLGAEPLRDLYARAELFFCNLQEAQKILARPHESDAGELLRGIRAAGPKIPIITDGPRGAYALDGDEVWHMPMYPDPAPPVDRTGAGDAFASTVTASLALGNDVPTALAWGPINSMSVVQQIGAQKGLLARERLEAHLKGAPSGYAPKKIS